MGTCLGKWVLEPLKVYHPFTGVTTNQSEGFNSTLKRLQRWREVPVDSVVLTLYHLQAYFYNEIQRGLAGIVMRKNFLCIATVFNFRIRKL